MLLLAAAAAAAAAAASILWTRRRAEASLLKKGGNDLPRELTSATSWAGPKNVLGFWLLLPGEGKEWGVSRDRPVKNG